MNDLFNKKQETAILKNELNRNCMIKISQRLALKAVYLGQKIQFQFAAFLVEQERSNFQ